MRIRILILLIAATAAFAQTQSTTNTGQAIPDTTALRLFLGSMIPSSAPAASMITTPAPTPKQLAILQRLRLSAGDGTILLVAANAFRAQATSSASLDTLAQNLYSSLAAELSPAGWSALLGYVRSEKVRMTTVVVPSH
jgi:hypothetical protein